MEYIAKLLENPASVIITICLVLIAIKQIFELYRWYKNRMIGYHHKLSEDEDFTEKVCEIACVSEKHTTALQNIDNSLIRINDRLDSIEQTNAAQFKQSENARKADIVANGRATLYHLYETLQDKEKLSLSEYETFKNIADRYLDAGGNGAFRDKIIPEIENKPIDE